MDVSLVDSVVSSLENAFQRYFDSGKIPKRNGNSYASIAPYDSYKAKDGFVIIACGNQMLFEKLCLEVIEMPHIVDDERFLDIPLRVINNEALKEFIEFWTVNHSVEYIVDFVLSKGIPAAPILNLKQIIEDEHIAKAREMFIDIEHPVIGAMKVNGNPVKLIDTMPKIENPAPTLGQHNEEILIELLGISLSEYEDLSRSGVI